MTYTTAERDRRWNAVRRRAADAGFDAVWVPMGNGPDGKYLTQFRTPVFLLPTTGGEPIVITDEAMSNEWIAESRAANRQWSRASIQAIADLGLERARIGVVGLRGGTVTHARSPDGVINHSSYAEVVARFPNATFDDATDLVGFVRYVKSEEEIACLKKAAAIAEAAIEEAVQIARPGLDEAVLYARMTGKMLALGSEYHPLALEISTIGGPPPVRRANPPIGRRLQTGSLIEDEVSAVWGGEIAQEDQPILLGPVPEAWKPVIDLQREVFEAGLEFMKPSTTFGELIDFVNGFGAKRSLKTLTLMHGRGYGDDGPLLSPRARGERIRDLRLEKGNAFVWKPYAMSADERIQFVWGGDIVIGERGGERLFLRPHGLISIT
jgi:Xaa-Pro dipeptidase